MIISMTHNGVSEMELCDVIPELTETFSSLLCYILQSCLILTSVTGLHVFDNDQVGKILSWSVRFVTAAGVICLRCRGCDSQSVNFINSCDVNHLLLHSVLICWSWWNF